MVDFSEDSRPQKAGQPGRQAGALKAGLTALQQQHYREAIAYLQSVAQSTGDPPTQFKAQMGLVKAYVGLDQQPEAIAICQQLAYAPSPSVQQWATQMLARLQSKASPPSSAGWESDLAAGLTLRKPRPSTPAPPSSIPAPSASIPAPSTLTPTPTPNPQPNPHLHLPPSSLWQQAGRAQQWGSLGSLDQARLWALEALTVAGLGLMLWIILRLLQSSYNGVMRSITFRFLDLQNWAIYPKLLYLVVPLVAIALLASIWALPVLVYNRSGMRSLPLEELNQYSPEAGRLLQNFARQRRALAPTLKYLPEAAPIALTYGGLLPRKAHLVLSQGLLERLSADEIAAIVAAELAHLRFRDAAVLSGLVTLAQLPYWVYWQVAHWGDRQSLAFMRGLATLIATLAYGGFWSLRLVGLWLSRVRLYYSDRIAAEMTGNPNALTRALLKISIGMAQVITAQGYTPPFLEQVDLLTPVGIQSALTQGSLYTTHPGPELLIWDYRNRLHRWLGVRDSHPPLGDRLHRLAVYAQRWRLPAEVDFPPVTRPQRPTGQERWRMGVQMLPMLGVGLGLLVGQGFWWFGAIADRMNWFSLDWFQNGFIHLVCLLIGFGVTTFLRINPFFPEIKRPNEIPLTNLPGLLTHPDALPADAPTIKLQGMLLGRRGIANALGQDLLLKTEDGLVRLHFLPAISFNHNPIQGWRQLQAFLNRPVLVTGWFRRGTTPWLDLDVMQSQTNKPLRAGHPLWSTLLALLAVLWSCYTIVTGDL